eukprot:TRINITY_DN223_c0_g1_i2.p1 TRINITY_DN223_c0_g1~~TRINITY_DN223_c0_g1_i2.p1  ORF type:complete len:55 (-),score=3.96 TRINITY_DN223_c0_g1_i2:471-635(-)
MTDLTKLSKLDAICPTFKNPRNKIIPIKADSGYHHKIKHKNIARIEKRREKCKC